MTSSLGSEKRVVTRRFSLNRGQTNAVDTNSVNLHFVDLRANGDNSNATKTDMVDVRRKAGGTVVPGITRATQVKWSRFRALRRTGRKSSSWVSAPFLSLLVNFTALCEPARHWTDRYSTSSQLSPVAISTTSGTSNDIAFSISYRTSSVNDATSASGASKTSSS